MFDGFNQCGLIHFRIDSSKDFSRDFILEMVECMCAWR